jgi:uncharacterized protein
VTKLHAVNGSGATEEAAIASDRLVEGAPMTRTSLDYERNNKLYAGEWSADVGAWRVKYEEWEFCHLLEGACELVGDDGETQRYAAGRQLHRRARFQRRLARHRADEKALRGALRLSPPSMRGPREARGGCAREH